MTDEKLVEVTQADRDAAAEHYCFVQSRIKTPHESDLQKRTAEELRTGRWDRDKSVQAFARHRIEALTAKADDGGVGELIAAIEALPIQAWINQDHHGNPQLIGYVMQAQGEWDRVRKALETLKDIKHD